MTMMTTRRAALVLLGAATILAALPATSARAQKEKMSVLVLGTSEKDSELADNVTEMIIAAVARRGAFEIAGKEEFRARLGVDSERRAQQCIDDISCLGRAAVSLGVRRIVAGSVGTRGKQYLFNLNLNNIESGKVENRVFRLIEGGVDDLIKAINGSTDELFKPKIEPGRIQVASEPVGARVSIDNAYLGLTPLISGTLLPGAHRVRVDSEGRFAWTSVVEVLPAQDLGINLTEANLPRRRRWPTRLTYASTVLAGASLAAGGFLGVLSQVNPSGETRQGAQDDFNQKQRLARGANIAFIAGGALALIAAGVALLYRDDVFGRDDGE